MKDFLFDVGHGGHDPGALNGVYKEKDIVLEIALKVQWYLREYNCSIEFTRTTDKYLSLKQRSDMSKGKDLVTSFHTNSVSSKEPNGFQTYIYTSPSATSKDVANYIQNEINLIFKPTKWSGVKRKNLHMVRETKCPAVLLEMFFISNDKDLSTLLNKQDAIASAIAQGLIKSCGLKKVSDVPRETLQKPKKKYKSITEYLQVNKQPYGFNDRKKLAQKHGISNYTGTAGQNIQLLKILQG